MLGGTSLPGRKTDLFHAGPVDPGDPDPWLNGLQVEERIAKLEISFTHPRSARECHRAALGYSPLMVKPFDRQNLGETPRATVKNKAPARNSETVVHVRQGTLRGVSAHRQQRKRLRATKVARARPVAFHRKATKQFHCLNRGPKESVNRFRRVWRRRKSSQSNFRLSSCAMIHTVPI